MPWRPPGNDPRPTRPEPDRRKSATTRAIPPMKKLLMLLVRRQVIWDCSRRDRVEGLALEPSKLSFVHSMYSWIYHLPSSLPAQNLAIHDTKPSRRADHPLARSCNKLVSLLPRKIPAFDYLSPQLSSLL